MEHTVLLYAPSADQARTLGTALAETRDTLTVEWKASRSDAFSRLGWPDIDCLVIVSERGEGITPFLRSVEESHPVLATVYYGMERPDIVGEKPWTAFVRAEGPTSIDPLAGQIEQLLEERDRKRTQYDLDGSTPAKRYPNVDDERVEEVLERGPDRETLRELLHKSQLFDAILETVPVHLYVKDDTARHRYVSKGYFEDEIEKFLDLAEPEMDLVTDDHAWRAFDDDMYVIEEGEAITNKEEYLRKLDQWNITSKVPWRDERGDIVGLIGVTRDITARKRREEDVKRQNERLESFSEIVSHDLKNPLQVAHSALTLVEEECDSEHIDTVSDAHERMDAIIDDVLSLARYGQTVVDTGPVNLAEQATQAWETAGNETGRLEVDDALGTIQGDGTRLARLLENLFRNSVAHAGPDVTVRVEPLFGPHPNQPGGESVTGFAVSDDGPGIAESERERVLELGYSTAEGGTGFGLGIVSEIVDAHGWSISVTESEQGGARFEITGLDRPF